MVKQFVMPGTVSYTVPGGVPVYYIDAVNKSNRPIPGKIETFILHDTDGRDSRQELYDSRRRVSVHYLVGEYPNIEGPVCIKYASERNEQTYGAGNGYIEGIQGNINATSVQFEIEYHSITEATIQAYALVVAHSLSNWTTETKLPVILPHWAVDEAKIDPRFNWSDMLTRIYRQYDKLRAL